MYAKENKPVENSNTNYQLEPKEVDVDIQKSSNNKEL